MRFIVAVVLAALLSLLQFSLWRQGVGVVAHHQILQEKLAQEKANTQALESRNMQLQAELDDLNEGTEVIEEMARHELKMVKPNEVLIQFR